MAAGKTFDVMINGAGDAGTHRALPNALPSTTAS